MQLKELRKKENRHSQKITSIFSCAVLSCFPLYNIKVKICRAPDIDF